MNPNKSELSFQSDAIQVQIDLNCIFNQNQSESFRLGFIQIKNSIWINPSSD